MQLHIILLGHHPSTLITTHKTSYDFIHANPKIIKINKIEK